jgi:hypothetical protein
MRLEARGARWAFALAGALALAGCHEIAQDATKSFAGKAETRLGDPKALAARAQGQNEYVRMGDVPK